jgi:autotransporter-associated beta strand protein
MRFPLRIFLLLGLCTPFVHAQTSVTVTSIAQLKTYASTSNATITLAPGTYTLSGPTTRPSPSPDYPVFLDLSGSNSTFVFTGVTLQVPTSELKGYGRVYGHQDTVRVLQVSGANTTVNGLTLTMVSSGTNGTDAYGDAKQYTADWSTTLVELIGSGVTVKNCTFTTGGSYPYGYGDAFGKGGRPADANGVTNAAFIDHRKQSGIRIGKGASGVTLDSVTLNMRSYGHGIFMQEGASDILIKNCSVLGDTLASGNTVRAHPLYQQWGSATYNQPVPADIQLSKSEDGIRVYVNDPTANSYPAYINNLTVQNCRVERMRDALATGDMTGFLRVTGTEAYGCETGFTPSNLATENTFTGCKGDAVNGPLVFFRRSATNVTMSVELAGADAPVGKWPVALISGSGHTITLTRTAAAGLYPADAYINCSQGWREWRHAPPADIDASSSGNVTAATTGCSIVNQTGLPLVFGPNATGNTATSTGVVINKGSGNTYTGTTLIPALTGVTDTWGTFTAFSGAQSAADLNALGGFNADAGTVVSSGATLTIGTALAFQGEPLALGGTLASPGAVANSTRFNSAATAAITLTGDAVMNVSTAANQFLVGPVSGTGNLQKTGPGDLVMESDANTFSGSLTISAGKVTARANKAVHSLFVASGASFRGQASLSLNQAATDQTVLDGTLVVNNRNDASTHTVVLGKLSGAGLITTTGTGLGTVSIAGDSTFNGVIEGLNGLTKTGTTTTLLLTATQTYTGPTAVTAGTLAVSGQLPSGTALTLSAGATLSRDVTLGALTVGTWTSASGSILRVTGAPSGFDSRRAYSWPVVTATTITGTAPTLDASSLPATTGTYALVATSTALTVTHTPSPYAAWQLLNNIPASTPLTADSNGDGLPDLINYATASRPILATAADRLTITFDRLRSELTYIVEASSDLVSWTVIATNPGTVGASITVTDITAYTPRRFLRLRVAV